MNTLSITEQFQWSFPGGMWALVVVLAGAVILIGLSYWLTLTRLPHRARILLSILRLLAVLLILACICRPTTIKQIRSKPDEKPKVAVVLDESGSMDVKSLWGHSRRDEALWYWHSLLSKQDKYFDLDTYAFAESMRRTKKLDEAYAAAESSGERSAEPLGTHLYYNLIDWSEQFAAQGYDAVVCLTDGVDTSNESRQKALDALRQTALPHAFVSLTMPLPSLPLVEITKLEVASTSQVGTNVPVNMLIQASGLGAERPLEVLVKQDEKVVHRQKISVFSHLSITQNVNFEVPVLTEETLLYDAQVLSGSEVLAKVKWSIQGLSKETPAVLLYQGALDWGTRQLRGVFDRAENAKMTVRFASDAIRKHRRGRRANNWRDSFPGPTELAQFNAVVLLNLSLHQITSQMESSLTDFVRNGGGLLIIGGNPAAAGVYGQSGLEAMLPVEFADSPAGDRVGRGLSGVHQYITQGNLNRLRSANRGGLLRSIVYRSGQRVPSELTPLTLTREGLENDIFNFAVQDGRPQVSLLPSFETLAPIRRAKPGARILALDDKSHIVLATQAFGRGRTGVLATDSLWRWRMSLPSDSSAFDSFWRQLIGYLTAGVRHQPAWLLDSVVYPPGKTVPVRFHLPYSYPFKLDELTFAAESPDDNNIPLTFAPIGREEQYLTTILTKPGTTYRLVARHKDQMVAEAFISGRAEVAGQELRTLKPDPIGLAELAAASGGVVIDPDRSFDWSDWLPQSPAEIIKTERNPLWHESWVFACVLALFILELLIRRRYRMI